MSTGEAKPKLIRVEDLLQRTVYDVDHRAHIVVDSEKCARCPKKPCTYLCPASCYVLVDDRIVFSYEGCLECGTCRVICPMEAITWNFPVSGKGVQYRFA